MSTTPSASVSAAELRRRVRAVEALQAKTREMAAANVLTTREAAAKAARAKEEADVAAREAAAVALRLFDNDAELVAELLGVLTRSWNARRSSLPPLARRRSSRCCGHVLNARAPADPVSLDRRGRHRRPGTGHHGPGFHTGRQPG